MSQDEVLPEDLNDCQRAFESLVPRASRIDRDRLMIRLGQQSGARGSAAWKWATAASLLLAFVLGVRPALVRQGAAPAQLANQSGSAAPRSAQPKSSRPPATDDVTPLVAARAIDDDAAWMLAVANGQYAPAGMLTVRPRPASAARTSRGGDGPAPRDVSGDSTPRRRAPMLRWSDRPLRRERVGSAAPPTS